MAGAHAHPAAIELRVDEVEARIGRELAQQDDRGEVQDHGPSRSACSDDDQVSCFARRRQRATADVRGGGKWEAMHGDMSGFYEARADGENREHFRLFRVLERDGARLGLHGPSLVIITGMRKPFRSTFTTQAYRKVRALRLEYSKRRSRSVA